jgi:hypothetical protein
VTVLYEATPVGVLPEVQNGMAERNAGLPPDRRIELRVGIHLGDVVEESDGDLMGDGVNIAARLEGIAKPGAICLSEDAYRQVRDRLQHEFIDLGEKGLKNIARPVRAYTIKIDSAGSVVPAQASGQDKAGHPRLSIVIAPFTNIGGDSEQEYFVDGVTESLTTDLSRISGVRSGKIARTGRSRCDRPIAYPHRPQSAREGAPVHAIIIAHGRPASANRRESRFYATAIWCSVGPPDTNRAGSAKALSSRPTAPCHSLSVADGGVHASRPCSTVIGEKDSPLQVGAAT